MVWRRVGWQKFYELINGRLGALREGADNYAGGTIEAIVYDESGTQLCYWFYLLFLLLLSCIMTLFASIWWLSIFYVVTSLTSPCCEVRLWLDGDDGWSEYTFIVARALRDKLLWSSRESDCNVRLTSSFPLSAIIATKKESKTSNWRAPAFVVFVYVVWLVDNVTDEGLSCCCCCY